MINCWKICLQHYGCAQTDNAYNCALPYIKPAYLFLVVLLSGYMLLWRFIRLWVLYLFLLVWCNLGFEIWVLGFDAILDKMVSLSYHNHIDRGHQPVSRDHHILGTVVARDMRQMLRTRLRTRRNAPHNSVVTCQGVYHSNNSLRHHVVGTLTLRASVRGFVQILQDIDKLYRPKFSTNSVQLTL